MMDDVVEDTSGTSNDQSAQHFLSTFTQPNNNLIFDVLSDDHLGGNQSLTLDQFDLSRGDSIDISALLLETATVSNLNNYLTVDYDQATQQVTLSIDRDGAETHYVESELLILNHQTQDVSLEELLRNNQIVY